MLTRRSVAALQSRVTDRTRACVGVATVVLLISGQGFRYLMGLKLYGVLCVAIVLAVAVCFPPSRKTLRLPPLLAAYVALAALGVAWSATRPVTALAVLVMIATTYLALSIVNGMSDVGFMKALYRGFQVSLYGAVLFELILTFIVGHRIHPLSSDLARLAPNVTAALSVQWSEAAILHGGPIQGFVGNRNPTGAIALFAAITVLVLWREGHIRRTDAIATLVTAVGVMLLTRSATVTAALLYLGVLVLAAFAIRAAPARLKRPTSVGLLVGTALAVAITLRFRWLVFGLLGRSVEASHRTSIWHGVIAAAERRPQGWGFVGYWPVWEQPYAGIIGTAGVFASHAHNAFLDSWLQMGIVGVALLVALVVQLAGSAWLLVEASTSRSTLLPLGWASMAAALILEAVTESRILVEGGWFLLVALLVSALRAKASAGVSARLHPLRRTRSRPLALRSADHGQTPARE